jgi:phosphatidylglycerol:prolipoprotein diacylglycerol transferase
VAGPAIPYITLPEIPLSFLSYVPILGEQIDKADPPTIKPFGTLVALGVYLGSVLALRRARERGLDAKKLNDFIFTSIGSGFVGAHVFDAIFYYPDKVAKNPLYLLELWAGLSSFGGFTGALIGAFIWKWRNRGQSILAMCDIVCSAFPLAWVFGRAGCSVAHDHPGRMTDLWLGVQYPNLPPGIGRFDLGLIECILTIPLALAFHIRWKQGPKFFGYYAGWMSIVYAPVRFGLDFLRVQPGDKLPADERYLGFTPAQFAAVGLFFLGIYILRLGKEQTGAVPATYEEARADFARKLAAEEADDDDEPAVTAPEAPAARRKKAKPDAERDPVDTKPGEGDAERGSEVEPAPEEAASAADEVAGEVAEAAPRKRRKRKKPAP